jgi:CubicO group peptidase (beta-lactamase class C family)
MRGHWSIVRIHKPETMNHKPLFVKDSPMRRKLLLFSFIFVTLIGIAGIAIAQPSDAILKVRQRFLDADINTLTFHNIDEIFETRKVLTKGPVWNLSLKPAPLDFSYEFDGKSIPAAEFPERTYTNAIIVMKDDKVVFERYFNQTNEDTHFLSMSVAKSITSILVGMAINDGAISSVNDLIVKYIPELKGSGYHGVTIRQALMMRSGCNWDERYDFDKATPMSELHHGAIVENRFRFTSPAKSLKSIQPPGTHFNYSTVESGVLGWVVERAAGKPIEDYMAERWWKRAGMQSYAFWIADGKPGVGRVVNGMGFNAVLRDYARIGLMMLHHGEANNQRLLPGAWVSESTIPEKSNEPITPGFSLGYQYQWWTLTDSDAYIAIGLQGQYIYVDPATNTVVVKVSYFPPGEQEAEDETLAFLRAVSKWQPESRVIN